MVIKMFYIYLMYLHAVPTVLYIYHNKERLWSDAGEGKRLQELNNLLKSHSKSLIRIKNRIHVKQQNRAESKVIGKMPIDFKGTTI